MSRLPWRRVAPVARHRRSPRAAAAVAVGRRRGGRRAPDRHARGCRRRADATSGGASLDARARCPGRPRGRRAPARRRLYADGRRVARGSAVRALRLARGARRPGVRDLARRHRRPPQPARRASLRRRRSSSSTSASRSSGRGSPGRRTPGGRRRRPSRTRRTQSPPATCSIPSTRAASRSSSRPCRCPRVSTGLTPADAARPAAARRRDGRRTGSSSTASRCSGSGGSVLPRREFDAAAKLGPGQRRGAGRGRRRAVRQGATRRGVLAPRAADAPVPEPGDGALPPRPPAPLGGRGEGGEDPARARHPGGAGHAPGARGGALPRRTRKAGV